MADKKYSVGIDVDVNTDPAMEKLAKLKRELELGIKKQEVDFGKELISLLSGGGKFKFAVGGYSPSDLISVDVAQALKKSIKETKQTSTAWERHFDDINDAVEAEFEGLTETFLSAERSVKRELNNFAQRWTTMFGIEFRANIAEQLGEQDFALPTLEMSEKERKRATQDFITSGDTIIYSPAAFESAIEQLAQKFQFANFPARRIPVRSAGQDDGRVSFRSASSYPSSRGQGAFDSLIPELSEEVVENFIDFLQAIFDIPGGPEKVNEYITKQLEDLVISIAKRGYYARERTFGKDEEGSVSSDTADSYMRADEALRLSIAMDELAHGLDAGTIAKMLPTIFDKFIASFNDESRNLRDEISPVFDKLSGDLITIESTRLPSSPEGIRGNLLGTYQDPAGIQTVPDPRGVASIVEQFLQNPAILAAGEDGLDGLFKAIRKKLGINEEFEKVAPTAFLSGSRSLSEIPDEVKKRIEELMKENAKFIIGDAPGIDAAFQQLLANAKYGNVEIYYSGEAPRNNKGNFPTVKIDGTQIDKDIAMTEQASQLIAVWDQVSKGTKRNIEAGLQAGLEVEQFTVEIAKAAEPVKKARAKKSKKPAPVLSEAAPAIAAIVPELDDAAVEAKVEAANLAGALEKLTADIAATRKEISGRKKWAKNAEEQAEQIGFGWNDDLVNLINLNKEKQVAAEKRLAELKRQKAELELKVVKEEAADIEQVAVEKKKVRKKRTAKPATEQVEAVAEPAAAEMAAAAKPVEGALRDISSTVIDGLMQILASSKKFIAAYDSEFVDATASVITEGAVVLIDEAGKFYNVMDLLHAPPASQEAIWGQARVGVKNMKQLQERAVDLKYKDPLGAGGGLENLQDFYPKLKALIDVINKLAELGIPLATAAGQGADFNRLAKAIQNVNEGIVENKLDLQPLLAPAGPYSKETMGNYPLAFQGGHDPRGLSTEVDIQKVIKGMTGPEAARIRAAADGKVKVGALLRVLYDNLAEDVKSLITLTEEVDKKTGQVKLGFTLAGDPAHTARADAKATAAMLAYLSSISGAAPSPAKPKTPKPPSQPPLGPEGRVQDGIPDNGYEPFLIQLKGMNSVLSSMSKTEQEIFQEKLKQFKNTEGQEKLYERIAALNEEIAALQKVGGPDSKKKADELQKEISRLELLGEANERRLASEVKFNARQDKFASDNYDTFKQQVDGVYAVEEADKTARASIIRGIKEQVAAEKEVEKQTKSLLNTWVTGRYALYDVGNAYAGVARQLWMASRQIFNITQAYRSYETAFTSVERAVQPFAATLNDAQRSIENTEEETLSLKNALIGLSETIPVAFEDLASIATLGAQMGVAASGIVGFTETVSQFSAVTGVSAETVAQKFGRIAELANVDYSEFNNLGSSILYAGINAVATESEIMSLAESIAAVSEQAAFAPDEIIGMATALASTGIQAEQARGVFTRVFADIDRAVSVGGKELTAFASVAGMSAQDFQQAWGTEGASYDVFRAILGGLGATSDLTSAFDKLNIVETREINTLTRLASNLNVVDQAIGDATSSFESGTFLGQSFNKTMDNLDAKIITFKNNLKSLAEALSGATAGALGVAVDVANNFLQALKEIAKNPIASWVATAGLGITTFGAAAAFGVSVLAKLIAQIYAFRVAAINTANDTTAVNGIGSMVKQLTGFASGLIEMRDQLQTPSPTTRGIITPTTFKLFESMEKRKQRLIEQDNLYLALLKGRGAEAVAAARMEADSITKIIMARRAQIQNIELATNLTNDEKASMLATIGGHQIYIATINGETRALTANEVARLRGILASEKATQKQKEYAASVLATTVALNTQTRTASQAGGGVLGLGSKFLKLGSVLAVVASVASTAYGLFEMLRVSAKETDLNFLEAGGGTASLRDAIKADTQEYMKLTEKQRASSEEFTTVTVKTKKSTSAVNDNAVSIKNWTGVSSKFVDANKDVIDGVEDSTVALGENTKAWFANAINQDENFQAALDKYPTLLNDLSTMGLDFGQIVNDIFNNPDVDPAGPIVKQIDGLTLRIGLLKKEQEELIKTSDTTGGGAGNSVRLAEIKKELAGLTEQQDKLQLTKDAIDSVRKALGTAIQKNVIYDAINDALGITNQMDNAILDLQEAFSEAAKSGEGMADVMADVKSAVITMLKDIDEADPEIIAQVNAEDTIGGLIAVTTALAETTKAAAIAESGLDQVGSSAFWSAGYISAFQAAVKASNYDEVMQVVKSLQALAVAATTTTTTGGETLAEKLNRLVSESFAAVDALMAVRSAVDGLGKSLGESKDWSTLTDAGRNNLQALQGVITSIGERAKGNFGQATTELNILKIAMQDAGYTSENAGLAFRTIDKAIIALGGTATLTKKQIAQLRKQFPSLFKEISNGLTQSAAKDPFFKTITEYASGISTAMKNALDFRYGKSTSYDALTQSWLDIKEAAESAAEAVKSADETINGLTADRAMLQYKLSVAERYGDTKRAAQLRAQLEKANRDIADATKARADAQEDATKTLKGDSAGAIKNRATVRGLVQTYTDYLTSLASTGMSSADLKKEAATLAGEFLKQGKSLGFAEDELKSYTSAFESDFGTIVDKLEQFRGDLVIGVNTDPALRAISEFVLAANEALAKIISPVVGTGTTAPTAPAPFEVDQAALDAINAKIANAERYLQSLERQGRFGAEYAGGRVKLDQYYAERRKIQGLASGGFVSGEGSSTSDSIPAMLSNGEFVMSAKSVSAYGVGFFNALNQQRVGFSPVGAATRQQQTGPSIVFLSPEDRQLLRQFGDRPVNLYADSTKIAEVANTGNTKMSRRGSR